QNSTALKAVYTNRLLKDFGRAKSESKEDRAAKYDKAQRGDQDKYGFRLSSLKKQMAAHLPTNLKYLAELKAEEHKIRVFLDLLKHVSPKFTYIGEKTLGTGQCQARYHGTGADAWDIHNKNQIFKKRRAKML
uniref:Uncharacterized protein n=1 Tax=Romanomermis culicivorax TaxID=13658 RepID=A0A915I7P2_ROMCU